MGRSKGGSGAKNGRDSNPKHLGVKVYGGQAVTAGSIIIKQRGTKIFPGDNVRRAGDDSLFATADGVVLFNERRNRKFANIVTAEQASAAKKAAPKAEKAPAKKTSSKAEPAEKKTAEKKPAAKKTTAKKAAEQKAE
ncbi:50S ribosomal protein L27 [Treponema pectinovorum]